MYLRMSSVKLADADRASLTKQCGHLATTTDALIELDLADGYVIDSIAIRSIQDSHVLTDRSHVCKVVEATLAFALSVAGILATVGTLALCGRLLSKGVAGAIAVMVMIVVSLTTLLYGANLILSIMAARNRVWLQLGTKRGRRMFAFDCRVVAIEEVMEFHRHLEQLIQSHAVRPAESCREVDGHERGLQRSP